MRRSSAASSWLVVALRALVVSCLVGCIGVLALLQFNQSSFGCVAGLVSRCADFKPGSGAAQRSGYATGHVASIVTSRMSEAYGLKGNCPWKTDGRRLRRQETVRDQRAERPPGTVMGTDRRSGFRRRNSVNKLSS